MSSIKLAAREKEKQNKNKSSKVKVSVKLKYNYKDIIFIMVIAIANIIANLINGHGTSSEGFGGVMLGISGTMWLSTFILIIRTPVLAELIFFLSQVLQFIYCLVAGATFAEALNTMDMNLLISFIALLIVFGLAKIGTIENEKLTSKIIRKLKYDRKLYNIKWYYKIILYSFLVISIMSLSNSEYLDSEMLLQGTSWRVYGVAAQMFPILVDLAILTTTGIAYEIFCIYILLEIFTIYLMTVSTSENMIIEAVSVAIHIVTIIYAVYRNRQLNDKQQEQREKEHKQKEQREKENKQLLNKVKAQLKKIKLKE